MSLGADPIAGSGRGRLGGPIPLAVILHANQHLITDGYDNREGLSEVLDALTTVAALHLKYRVPLHLNVSGTFIEATAWHAPEVLGWVRALRRSGLLELLGSAYAQSILTGFGPEHNRRQLEECLRLCRHHLGATPQEMAGMWVPERVWDTALMAPVVGAPDLPNGGYRYVLLDDRLAYPVGALYAGSERERFDQGSTPGCTGRKLPTRRRELFGDGAHLRPWVIEGAEGLLAVPLSGDLRYAVPPRRADDWVCIDEVLDDVEDAGAGAIAVYGDDLERVAAVGPWADGRWARSGVAPYEAFLKWISESRRVAPVLLSRWLGQHPPASARRVDAGTFFELSQTMGAGEDCSGWWKTAEWQPYRRLLTRAEHLLEAEPAGARRPLWELAWKQLMASTYETGWHSVLNEQSELAPWARAVAAHARSVFVIAAAAVWRTAPGSIGVQVVDLDCDGDPEVVAGNEHFLAVLTPANGGRLVYLFDLDRDALVVGNPADDWNWQQELNRFMEVPRNHPGAFADVGHENDCWEIGALRTDGGIAEVELRNCEPSSLLYGATKTFRFGPSARALEVDYSLPACPERFGIDVALSPDYLELLRGGRASMTAIGNETACGWSTGPVAVWLQLPAGEPVVWDVVTPATCGHGRILRVAAFADRFRLVLGTGDLPTPTPPLVIDLDLSLAGSNELALGTAP